MAGAVTFYTVSSITKTLKGVYHSEAGRRQPIRVTGRILIWQFWRRILRRPLHFKTATRTRLILLPGASDTLSSYWYHQIPEFEELTLTLHLLRPGDLFVDVGANQGGWSLIAAGRGARVISFEPVPVTRQRLLANLAANTNEIRQRVSISPVGLSDFAGQVTFTADLDAGNHRLRGGEETGNNTVAVELRRADDVLRDKNPVVIKIDVEGEELGVLRGGRNILAKPSLRAVVMETFRPFNFAKPALIAAEAILLEHGFIPMAYEPWKRELRPLLKPSDGMQNTTYIRDHSAALALLKQAEPVCAFGTKV
jgi:FkbM family methyltransferase